MAKKKNRGKKPPWTPFKELDADHWRKLYKERYGPNGIGLDSAGVNRIPNRVFENSRYTVFLHEIPKVEGWPPMITLSIRLHTRDVIRDWRDLQRIKNEVVGPQHEAVELFPAESRLMDTANQFHLWVIAEEGTQFPFGFTRRSVADGTGKPDFMGAVQRKLEEVPPDALTQEQSDEAHKEALRKGVASNEPVQQPGTVKGIGDPKEETNVQ